MSLETIYITVTPKNGKWTAQNATFEQFNSYQEAVTQAVDDLMYYYPRAKVIIKPEIIYSASSEFTATSLIIKTVSNLVERITGQPLPSLQRQSRKNFANIHIFNNPPPTLKEIKSASADKLVEWTKAYKTTLDEDGTILDFARKIGISGWTHSLEWKEEITEEFLKAKGLLLGKLTFHNILDCFVV